MLPYLNKSNIRSLRRLKDAHRYISSNAYAIKAFREWPKRAYAIEQKFYPEERERTKNLESSMDNSIDFYEEQIRIHQSAVGFIKQKTFHNYV
ncbi:unnamed protein product [Chrysodeixis includens]|uniref:Uncharacterized protein n=1 Tax=Chrysodeixis includens TaxID=689277 RepID=A0A9P0DZM4_CHRIL|nr:unnamed protein product [Chrysodeixis includens]